VGRKSRRARHLHEKVDKCLDVHRFDRCRTRGNHDEKKLTRLEEKGQAALEVAQEEDAPEEATAEDEKEVI